MTYDPNFPGLTPHDESFRNNPLHTKVPMDDTGSGWSSLIAVASIVFIVGALIMFGPDRTDRTTTASNDSPAVTHSTPPAAPRVMPDPGVPTPQPTP
jgi:hypothetical protein